jgi:predicted phage baseplate assembly protein
MPLPDPQFESRTYSDIFNEALARIAAHTPEWTNRSEPDPGITLLQLFSFMTENVLYRTNLIPERNRQKFLRLLQIPLRPAAAANGLVSFSNPRGTFENITVKTGQKLAAGNVAFKTLNGLAVLPIDARLYYKKPVTAEAGSELNVLYRNLYAAFDLPENQWAFYETAIFEPTSDGLKMKALDIARETVDGSLWVAILARATETPQQAREKIANSVLSLGLQPSYGEDGCQIQDIAALANETNQGLVFEIPNASDARIRYQPLEYTAQHNVLTQAGVVKLNIPAATQLQVWQEEALTAGVDNRPPSLANTDDQERLVTWIRIRAPQIATGVDVSSRQLSIKLAWVGINAASVMQRIDVTAERLSDGNGKPNQQMRLLNRPVIENSFSLFVNGERWTEVDDLAIAGSEIDTRKNANTNSNVFRLDREAGEIYFGNGLRGARPSKGAVVQASYAYGGGLQGLVGVNTIIKAPNLPSGIKVTNPVPTWGATAAEKVADGERIIPTTLRHRDRLMSEQDYKDIVQRTPGIDLGRVDVLPLFHPKLPNQISNGVVTLLVVPLLDIAHPDSPEPDQLFLQNVCRYLKPRRILTTELHIRGPVYKELWVSVGINLVPGADHAPVYEAVKQEVKRFLSPLQGGFANDGWPLEKTVDALEISAAVARISGVSKINQLRLAESSGPEVATISMQGLNLPRVLKVAVVEGDALSIEDIRGDTTEAPPINGTNILPIPVIPQEC